MIETAKPLLRPLLRQPTPAVSADDRPPRARTPGGDHVAEIERLRRRVSQQDHALGRLSEALLVLRQGAQALREENRELRLQLAAAQRGRSKTSWT